MIGKLWVDDLDDTVLPVIPWLTKPWGTLRKNEKDDLKAFLAPLDKAGDIYLEFLWRENIAEAVKISNIIKDCNQCLQILDEATDTYLYYYWAEKVEETKNVR